MGSKQESAPRIPRGITRRAFLEKRIVPILIATGATATLNTSCQRPPETNQSQFQTAVAEGVEATRTAEKTLTPSGLAQVMTEVVETHVPLTPTQTGFGAVMTRQAETPSPTSRIAPSEIPTTTENLQNIQFSLVADVPTGTAIISESMELELGMIEHRVAEVSQLDGSSVQVDQNNRIIVEINGVSNPQRAIETVSQRGLLEFLAEGSTALQDGQFVTTSEGAPQETTLDGNIYKTILQNSHFKNVSVDYSSLNQPRLRFILTDEGAKIFDKYTQSHDGEYLGIAMDKRIVSSPVIQGSGNDIVINGNFTLEELQKFVIQIKYGPLPFPLKVIKSVSLSQSSTLPKTPKPVEKQEGKITLNPQDLYKALLTTPIAPDDLPAGFVSKGNKAANLDATAQAFNAIGQVMISIYDNDNYDPMFGGQPNAALTYVVFPKSSDAKDAFDTFKTTQSGKTPPGFESPAFFTIIKSLVTTTYACFVLFDNVFAGSLLSSVSLDPGNIVDEKKEEKTISLAKAGIKHLQKVGNPA